MTKFPFSDLHSFKDFVVFVGMCAPDRFPRREGVPERDQWTLDLAFKGLREGLESAIIEKGQRAEIIHSIKLIDEARTHYDNGNAHEGYFAIDEVRKKLSRVRTW